MLSGFASLFLHSCIKDDENDPRAIDSSTLPLISTKVSSGITSTTARSGGIITSDGGAPITARGVCWSMSPNPTLLNAHTNDGGGSGTFNSDITGLNIVTTYFVRAYATNLAGTAYGQQDTFTTDLTLLYGTPYAGGLVFYLDTSGEHGLVCAEVDQSDFAPWGCQNVFIPGADGITVGTGQENTDSIVSHCLTSGIAARICDSLVLNGYSDWFLPSRDELQLMYDNLEISGLGNFTNAAYWSSTEMTNVYAWQVVFSTGFSQGTGKSSNALVRAVRKF